MNPIRTFALVISFCFHLNMTLAQPYTAGTTYIDPTTYVEYRAGNLPIIISAPHGGGLEPVSIPDRDCPGCLYLKDSWTKSITEGVYDEIVQTTGCYPHVIINLLHRKKFDANRDIGDAADGNPTVEQAWTNYHAFIDAAKAQIVQDYGRGLFLDIHGHAHTIQRIELGYLLSDSELRLSDATLNTNAYVEESSIRTLVGDNIQSHTHADLLRGDDSFGTLMDEKGFPSVPSMNDPFPMVGDSYFNGGYNTQRHGSRDNGGEIDAIQVELNQDIRFNATPRATLIDSLARAANQYIDLHYNNLYLDNYCGLLLPVELLQFDAITEKNKVLLAWKTSMEINNDFFEIERKNDNSSFKTIGKIEGNVHSDEEISYRFTDFEPKNGINYYRLKQVDLNGDFKYSEMVSVEMKNTQRNSLEFFPNPSSSGRVRLNYLSNQSGQLNVQVYDIAGQLVSKEMQDVVSGMNQLQFDFSTIGKGMFFIKFEHEGMDDFVKLVLE